MLISAAYLLTLFLPAALAAPHGLASLEKRDLERKDINPEWIARAKNDNWACVDRETSKQLKSEAQMYECQENLLHSVLQNGLELMPGKNMFVIRTDLGMTWRTENKPFFRDRFTGTRWNDENRNEYHVIVFDGAGNLDQNGRTLLHERTWGGNAREEGDKVVFS